MTQDVKVVQKDSYSPLTKTLGHDIVAVITDPPYGILNLSESVLLYFNLFSFSLF